MCQKSRVNSFHSLLITSTQLPQPLVYPQSSANRTAKDYKQIIVLTFTSQSASSLLWKLGLHVFRNIITTVSISYQLSLDATVNCEEW